MTSSPDFDRSLLGTEFDLGNVAITRQMLDQYCEAIGDLEAAATSTAPVTLPTILIAPSEFPSIGLKHSGSHVLATWQLESRKPIYLGDTIAISMRLEDVYAKTGRSGTMVFVVWRASFANQHGETVALGRKSFITRPVAER